MADAHADSPAGAGGQADAPLPPPAEPQRKESAAKRVLARYRELERFRALGPNAMSVPSRGLA